MRACDIIAKKKAGNELSAKEIDFLIEGYMSGLITDYQISALLMAICFQGMNQQETFNLTSAMMNSGLMLDLEFIGGVKIDKHSTGGVGDKISLVLAPLAASAGIYVPMISGRSLGHTGGTLDKLESIPGFQTDMSVEDFIEQIKEIGVAIMGQTKDIAPADKRIYALRDVTCTVDSIPLITASILSKKIAEGADGYVFDVKVGKGAFVKNLEEARMLAFQLVNICQMMGRKAISLITSMDQPLGYTVGNSVEVIEAIEVLKGKGAKDVTRLSLVLAAEMLYMANKVKHHKEGVQLLKEKLEKGEALIKFRQLIQKQKGNPEVINDYSLFKPPKSRCQILSPLTGYISEIDAFKIAAVVNKIGAGREKADSTINHSVGLILRKKAGEYTLRGEVLAELLLDQSSPPLKELKNELQQAFDFSDEEPEIRPLIIERIGAG
jgi:pyrimidine-nucleoside phosphorylase